MCSVSVQMCECKNSECACVCCVYVGRSTHTDHASAAPEAPYLCVSG